MSESTKMLAEKVRDSSLHSKYRKEAMSELETRAMEGQMAATNELSEMVDDSSLHSKYRKRAMNALKQAP